MIRSVFGLLRAVTLMFVGNFDQIRDLIYRNNPQAIKAKYEDIINAKTGSVGQFVSALSEMVAMRDRRRAELKILQGKMEEHNRIKAGALAMAQKRAAELQAKGKTPEQIKADEQYIKAQAGYRDASSSLEQYVIRSKELAEAIEESDKQISIHKVRLQSLQREIQRLREESSDTAMKIISASEESKMNALVAGLSTDQTSREMEEVRNLRDTVLAEASVTRELSGASAEAAKNEFLHYAETVTADAEFDKLVGLKQSSNPVEVEEESGEPVGTPRIPE